VHATTTPDASGRHGANSFLKAARNFASTSEIFFTKHQHSQAAEALTVRQQTLPAVNFQLREMNPASISEPKQSRFAPGHRAQHISALFLLAGSAVAAPDGAALQYRNDPPQIADDR
jgi:hypothetical protein